MFEPFERGTAGRSAGLGLGLYIAAEIVRSHRGTIKVHSDDVVTTLTCRLPRARV
jgi:signal transduction histidine kinase